MTTPGRHTFKITFDKAAITPEHTERIGAAMRKAALFEITELGVHADVIREDSGSCGGCNSCKAAAAEELLRGEPPQFDTDR